MDNLCPYFWFTVGCIGMLLPVMAARIFATLMERPIRACSGFLYTVAAKVMWITNKALSASGLGSNFLISSYSAFDPAWIAEPFISNMSDRAIYLMWKANDQWPIYSTQSLFRRWKDCTPNWKEILEIVIAKEIKLEKAKRLRAYMIGDIAHKVAGIVCGVVFSGALIAVLASFIACLVSDFTITVASMTVAIFILALISLIVVGLDRFWPRISAGMVRGLKVAFKPMGIFLMYGKAVLSKNCPAIDWN